MEAVVRAGAGYRPSENRPQVLEKKNATEVRIAVTRLEHGKAPAKTTERLIELAEQKLKIIDGELPFRQDTELDVLETRVALTDAKVQNAQA